MSYGFGRMPRAEMGLIGGLQNVEGLDPITHQAMANNMFAPSKLDRLLEKYNIKQQTAALAKANGLRSGDAISTASAALLLAKGDVKPDMKKNVDISAVQRALAAKRLARSQRRSQAISSKAALLNNLGVGGDERNAAASDILASIKRDSDHDFAEVHNVLTEGKKLDQHYSFSAE